VIQIKMIMTVSFKLRRRISDGYDGNDEADHDEWMMSKMRRIRMN